MGFGRACIFVDGENLRHSLLELFRPQFSQSDYLPRNADWPDLFDELVKKSGADSKLRAYWYVVENLDTWPFNLGRLTNDTNRLIRVLEGDRYCRQKLGQLSDADKDQWAKEKLQDLRAQERSMRSRFEGWKTFQDGIVQRHDAIEFRRSGSLHYNLFTKRLGKEKAVDVHLATDMLRLKDIYDVGIILSGDQDYVPAVKAAKDCGKHIINVSFLRKTGQVLPGGARRLNQATDRTIELSYDDVLCFMNFPRPPVQPRVAAAS
jgi:uncharacterized LabA/DUF88 family protein